MAQALEQEQRLYMAALISLAIASSTGVTTTFAASLRLLAGESRLPCLPVLLLHGLGS